jgi:ribosomal protein L28
MGDFSNLDFGGVKRSFGRREFGENSRGDSNRGGSSGHSFEGSSSGCCSGFGHSGRLYSEISAFPKIIRFFECKACKISETLMNEKTEEGKMSKCCFITIKSQVRENRIHRRGKCRKNGGIGTHIIQHTKGFFKANLQRTHIMLPSVEVKCVLIAVKAIKQKNSKN